MPNGLPYLSVADGANAIRWITKSLSGGRVKSTSLAANLAGCLSMVSRANVSAIKATEPETRLQSVSAEELVAEAMLPGIVDRGLAILTIQQLPYLGTAENGEPHMTELERAAAAEVQARALDCLARHMVQT